MKGVRLSVFFKLIIFLVVISLFYKIFTGYGSNKASQPPQPSSQLAKIVPPCRDKLKTIALGMPFRGSQVAFFNTDGSDLYLTAHDFPKGGVFDPKVGSTLVNIGESTKLPVYDEQRSTVSNTLIELEITESQYTQHRLPAGRYWLWTSNFADIKVASCGLIS